jgi:hypothetical protein
MSSSREPMMNVPRPHPRPDLPDPGVGVPGKDAPTDPIDEPPAPSIPEPDAPFPGEPNELPVGAPVPVHGPDDPPMPIAGSRSR